MAWEIIEPKMGRSAGPGSEVTVAWRKTGSHAGNRLVINMAKSLLAKMGWDHGAKIQIERDCDLGLLRLTLAPPQKRAMTLNTKDGTGSVFVALDSLTLAQSMRAEIAPFVIQGSALVITLPDWAAPERVATLEVVGSVARGTNGARAAADAARARMHAVPFSISRAGLG
ncbi:hypothetical protein [Roseomonas haemaphysalidis]|uniref:Uncharacterized protein n=1 Tax=Roseomonas haemaphysalidis TaxID=2768162 RepID=A0ABS3KTS7_9PROT|nr:hypothetical protein [Roseomonas haemaphysalidis]MBO1080866.1 hypothetical protein [Roseomonas haemaphysalidis]